MLRYVKPFSTDMLGLSAQFHLQPKAYIHKQALQLLLLVPFSFAQ